MAVPANLDPAPHTNGGSGLVHMAQLDGLRAIAVSAVVVHHFGSAYFSVAFDDAARIGVKLFFVLSGFLITGILLAARDKVTRGASIRSRALKNFYLRRVLRIFPLYYLVVLVTVALDIGPARELAWWLLTYTLNLKMAAQGWYEAAFAHFWSLNVEEQFYIVWPWAVLLLPRRWLTPTAIAMIAVTPLWKVAYVLSNYSLGTGLATYIGTWSCLDSLGIGALMAILRHGGSTLTAPGSRWALTLAIVGASATLWFYFQAGRAAIVMESTAQAVVFAWLILKAADGFTGPFGAALRWKPAAFVGKISYGVYVYHPFVPGALSYLLLDRTGGLISDGWPGVAVAVTVTLAVSAASWFIMESPINGLKERFR